MSELTGICTPICTAFTAVKAAVNLSGRPVGDCPRPRLPLEAGDLAEPEAAKAALR